MSNIEIQNNDTNGIVIWEPVYVNETLTAAGAVTWVPGTLLGRITASGKLTAYDSGAGDGSEVIKAVLAETIEFTGAGDKPTKAIEGGQLRRADMIEHGVGTPITNAQADQLRDYGIVVLVTNELAQLDNQ
jgi:hypothetical protein